MDKRSMVISVLEDMGYQPWVDSDGDVLFRFQMKHLYVLATQQEENPFLVVMLPQFYEMSEGEEIKVLTVCNKLTREVRLAKIYIDTNLTEVTASCEFFYCDEASLRLQLEHSLVILGRVRSAFRQALVEFEE